MKTKLIVLGILFTGVMRTQSPPDRYTAQATGSGGYTIQAPATNGRQIVFGAPNIAGASVYCAAADTAVLSWNGTAATATTSTTEIKLPGVQQPSGMTLWTGSNVGSGTTGPSYTVVAGATLLIDLYNLRLSQNGTGNNLTLSTTGSCTKTFYYSAT